MSTAEIVIGSVPYLNARPLVSYFSATEAGRKSGVRVVEAVPSALAEMLKAGSVAAALVSSIELFRNPGWTYAPDVAIAADGAVESVRLFSRVPFDRIETVALDTSSLTSVALLQILLTEKIGIRPDYVSLPPDADKMLAVCDAALLIGDNGYREWGEQLFVLDLGAAWKQLTGLPFVYALWLGLPERLTDSLAQTLRQAKEWGVGHRETIAQAEHERVGETLARARHYLTDVMRYDLGPREIEALHLFGEKARKLGTAQGSG